MLYFYVSILFSCSTASFDCIHQCYHLAKSHWGWPNSFFTLYHRIIIITQGLGGLKCVVASPRKKQISCSHKWRTIPTQGLQQEGEFEFDDGLSLVDKCGSVRFVLTSPPVLDIDLFYIPPLSRFISTSSHFSLD